MHFNFNIRFLHFFLFTNLGTTPYPPTNVTVSVSAFAATIMWHANFDGGFPQHFTIRYVTNRMLYPHHHHTQHSRKQNLPQKSCSMRLSKQCTHLQHLAVPNSQCTVVTL